MGQMLEVSKAATYIMQHSHFATVTPDGLLAVSGAVWSVETAAAKGIPADDRFTEETEVFPVTEAGYTDFTAIRAWLGY